MICMSDLNTVQHLMTSSRYLMVLKALSHLLFCCCQEFRKFCFKSNIVADALLHLLMLNRFLISCSRHLGALY